MSDKFCLSPFKVTESGTDYICPLGLIGGQDSATVYCVGSMCAGWIHNRCFITALVSHISDIASILDTDLNSRK